jgi:hypothetical protein
MERRRRPPGRTLREAGKREWNRNRKRNLGGVRLGLRYIRRGVILEEKV